MTIPPVLAKFCGNFFAHFHEFYTTPDEMTRLGLSSLSESEKAELASILEEIISPRHSAGDLLRLWRSSPADVHFADGEELRAFLMFVRSKIG